MGAKLPSDVSTCCRPIPTTASALALGEICHVPSPRFLKAKSKDNSYRLDRNVSDMTSTPNKFLTQRKVNVLSAPFSGGQGKGGVDDGPKKLLDHGLLEDIKRSGWQVSDETLDLTGMKPAEDPPMGNMKNTRYVSKVTKHLADACAKSQGSGGLTLTVGGDHSLAIGTIAGLMQKYPEACVLWIDAQ